MGAPKPPDPEKTAAAQSKYDKQTAQYQQELNQTNQVTPQGTLTYTQIGTNADGSPRYQANTTYNPETQSLYDTQTQAQTQAASAVSGILGANNFSNGPDLGPNADETGITSQIMQWGDQYYQPIFDQQTAQAQQKLQNQGIAPGSKAYNDAMNQLTRNQGDTMTNLLLQGQNTALSAGQQNMERGLEAYNAPLSAIATLSGTSPPPSLSFAQTPQTSVQTPDYQGLVEQQYQQQVANYNNMLGGLFSIPKTLFGGLGSL